MLHFLKQPRIVVNLLLMCYMWICVNFDYTLNTYQLRYLPGDLYMNAEASSVAELIAYTIAGVMYDTLGVTRSFLMSYSVSVIGGILCLTLGGVTQFLMPFYVLLAKLGISSAFVVIYVCNVDVFPAMFLPIAFGITNFAGAVSTIGAPVVGEMHGQFPMVLFTGIATVGLLLSIFIVSNREHERRQALNMNANDYLKRQENDKADIQQLDSSIRY